MPSLTQLPVRVLVLGGSYSGLAVALNLLDLCQGKSARFAGKPLESPPPAIPVHIKIIDERDGYYHVIGSPLALASKNAATKSWVRFQDLPCLRTPFVSFTQGSAVTVDCESKTATIKDSSTGKQYDEAYDYLVVATGLRRAWPAVPQALSQDGYREEAYNHISKVSSANSGVVVVGGGAVGIEMASELKLLQPTQSITLIHSRSKLMSSEPLPDDFKDRALSVLQETGVEVILNDRVISTTLLENGDSKLVLGDGSEKIAGEVIWALSKQSPTSSFLPESARDAEGYVKIAPTLNFLSETPNSSAHFAVGDIALWSGIKRCGAAMHMGHFAAINIHQALLSSHFGTMPKFVEIKEFQNMIALAVGNKAVGYSPDDGTTSGEALMEMMFGNDLGFSICWNYLQLGIEPSAK